MGALKKMLVIGHRRFLQSLERTVFCLPAFFLQHQWSLFCVMSFPLCSFYQKLFGNLKPKPNTEAWPTTTNTPTSFLPAITPSLLPSLFPPTPCQPVTCQQCPRKVSWSIIIYLMCEKGELFPLYSAVASPIIFGALTASPRGGSHILWILEILAITFVVFVITRLPYNIDFSSIL